MATEPNHPGEQPTSVQDIAVNPLLSPEAQAHQRALVKDWTQYVAVVDIPDPYGGSVLAYRAGDPVPASNVKAWQYGKDLVAKVGTKEAENAQQVSAPRTPSSVKRPGD